MKRPLVWFTLAVVGPGLILAGLGTLAIRRDWSAVDEEIRARTSRTAAEAARRVDEEVDRWREAVRAAAAVAGSPRAMTLFPGSLAAAFDQPGNALFVTMGPSGWTTLPRDGLLYRPMNPDPGPIPADLGQHYSRCAALERRGDAGLRLCGSALYVDLLSGRWLLVRPLFVFYAERARSWAGAAVEKVSFPALTGPLAARRELADAVEAVLGEAVTHGAEGQRSLLVGNGPRFLAIVQPRPNGGWAALVVTEAVLSQALLGPALSGLASSGYGLSLEAADGEQIFSVPAGVQPLADALPFLRRAALAQTGVATAVRVWPLDVAGLHNQVARRRSLYIALLVVVASSTAFGSFFTVRAIRRELRAASMQSEFVSMITHEFRTPLTGIRQLTEMLAAGRVPSDERRQEYYSVVMRETHRLQRLVDNVLGITRQASDNQLFSFEPLDTTRWLRWLASDCQQEHSARGGQMVVDVPENLPAVMADRDAITAAVRNLLDNASKYSPAGGTVWLSAAAGGNGSEVVIRVRDRGIGIPPSEHKRIFDRFYRGHEASRSTQGSGLGLTLVKHVMNAHGGRVSVESVPGQGSTFSLVLPAIGPYAEE